MYHDSLLSIFDIVCNPSQQGSSNATFLQVEKQTTEPDTVKCLTDRMAQTTSNSFPQDTALQWLYISMNWVEVE